MLDTKSILELEAMTKEAIIAEIVAERPTTSEVCTKVVDGVNGQISREFVTKDLAGAVIKTEQLDWKYDKAGVVSEITKTVLDAKAVTVEAVKIATVDGVLKVVPVAIKEILPIDEKLPVEEVIAK